MGETLKLSIIKTNNFSPWTQHYAREIAVEQAKGEKLICLDVDHIVTKELVDFVKKTDADVIKFQRRFGILDKEGNLQTNRKTMIRYGALETRINKRGCRIPPPGNVFAISKSVLLSIKGKSGRFWHILKRMAKDGKIKFCKTEERPVVYMFPSGRYCGDIDADPLNLFHGLSRKMGEYQDAETYIGAR